PFALADDLYKQASTLGPRAVDELNRIKARRQESLQAVGMTAAITGAVLAESHSRELRRLGFLGFAAGLATYIFSEAAITPEADTRAWSTLPGTLWLAVARRPPGPSVLEIRVSDGFSPRTARFEVDFVSTDTLVWKRILPRGQSIIGLDADFEERFDSVFDGR
ncbi:MAG TPA: hypothetical protein VK116_08760, partial [Planctomycetota bacterium]|nr:hypothetical protein [Planctomycetota bacterium]